LWLIFSWLVANTVCVCLFVCFLFNNFLSLSFSLWEKKRNQDWVLGFTQFRYNVLLLCSVFFFFFFFFSLLCFGCPAIVAVLVIVGRDTGRGAGEESVVAEDIATEVFDERFERNKES
jgi:hypothetical protein